ncbi:GNAT family N-acetyltransferase [Streptomyces sp. NPDC002055]|uniref:GNAT family N-acetyltransferase n=1 Tax=Streptomyces sp. NPDC002055 TaxID=3154534 RepID=UPI00332989C7
MKKPSAAPAVTDRHPSPERPRVPERPQAAERPQAPDERAAPGHPSAADWEIAPVAPDHPDAVAVLHRYYADIVSRYHGRTATEEETGAAVAEDARDGLVPPTGVLLLARCGGVTVGSVGVRLLTPDTAELTRVFVLAEARRRGGGARLLAAAERAARGLGATAVRLDTRHDLVEARGLYARHGYAEIPAYNDGPYADHWFEKALV